MNELNNLPEGMLGAIFIVVGVLVLIGIIIYCLYVKNLQDTLKAVRPENRQMAPGQVWLLLVSFLNLLILVPVLYGATRNITDMSESMYSGMNYASSAVSLFCLIWQFRIVQKLSDSIAKEYASRNIRVEAKPTYQVGLVYCILMLVSLLTGLLPRTIASLNFAIGVATLVYWIMYWVKTAGYKKELRVMPEHNDNESELFRNLY